MSAGAMSGARRPVARGRWVRRNAWIVGVYVLLAILLVAERFVNPHFDSFAVQTLVLGALPLALAAMAQAAVVLAGGIDLAIGSMMSLINVASAALMLHTTFPGALAICVVLIAGSALAGALTGAVITVTRVPDIIVTLATSFVWAGLALQVMPTPGGGAQADFVNIFMGEIGAYVPSGLIVLVAAVCLVWIPFRRSRLGLALYALGSNRTAAFLSGVSVARTRVTAYALNGVFAALAGLALTATTSNGSAVSGTYFTLNSVAAVVLGGVSLAGGRGGMVGPVAAAFVLTLLTTMLTDLGVDQNYSQVIQGTLIVIVVLIGGLVLVRRRT